jgi:hypothetical protein
LDREGVLPGPSGPGAAEDAGPTAVTEGVVAEVETGFVAAENLVGGRPCQEDVVGFLGVGLVACEIPHAREVVEGDHVAPPRPEVFVGIAFHHLERPAHDISKLGAPIGRQRGIA